MSVCEFCGMELSYMPKPYYEGKMTALEWHRQAPMTNHEFKMARSYGGLTTAGWMCPALKKPKGEPKFVFITIQDFQRRIGDIEMLLQFIKNISYMYADGYWCIEAGKNVENFNVHIHMLVKIRPTCKNHKKVLNTKWMKYFNTSMYDADYYLIKQHRDAEGMPSYTDWCQEKLDYFDNQLKGTHANALDLQLAGRFGAEGP